MPEAHGDAPVRYIVLLIACALCGCAAQTTHPAAPTVLRVPERVYVPIPAALTATCPIAEPSAPTVGEAIRVARERRAALESCNADKRQIRALQGSTAQEPQT